MPDQKIEAPPLDVLKTRHSSKWRRFPEDVLPMHVAEMDFPIAEPIQRRIITMVSESDLGYLGPIPEVANAFAKFAKNRWNWTIDEAQLKLATDVGVAVVEFLRANNATNTKVIVNSPVYHGFWEWLGELNITPVDVPLNPDYSLDIDGIEKEFANGVKYLLLCNPQNPVGKAFSREDLTALAHIAKKHDAIVISDEIHAPLTYKNETFTPYLDCGPEAEETGVCITSASKSWNLAGLKAAFLLTQSKTMQSMVNRMPQATHWRSSIVGAFAMAEAYENGDTWLDSTLQTLDENRHHLKRELQRLFPEVNYIIPEAGYLAWLDVASWKLGDKTVDHLIQKAKVALVPGNDHGPQYANHVRFNFGTSPELITEGLTRIAGALNR
jgi:cystathionine beta-lyase